MICFHMEGTKYDWLKHKSGCATVKYETTNYMIAVITEQLLIYQSKFQPKYIHNKYHLYRSLIANQITPNYIDVFDVYRNNSVI